MRNFNLTKLLFNFLLVTSLTVTHVMAQSNVAPSPRTAEQEVKMEKLRNQWNEKVGTFQIQIVNSRSSPQVNVVIIEEIEAARKEHEVTYIPFQDNIRIMILPRETIEQRDFIKVELFKYIEE
jgi:hypothetical protein